MSVCEIFDLTLAQASAKIASAALSPVEYTQALVERSEALQAQLFAFVTPTFESALETARTAEHRLVQGNRLGPLDGVPFALKDIYDTAGILTSGHSKTCIDRIPKDDATSVAKLKSAGAVLTGKLATHEFAHGGPSFDLPWPPARNPWNTAHFTGGSSSGSGAAIAAGLAPITLGSDTGGSIRGPAGLCGTAGLKPTYGLVSRRGVLPNSFSYDHCGPLARTAEDCAMIMNVIAGYDAADPASARGGELDFGAGVGSSIKGMKIGVIRHFWESDAKVHPELPTAMENALDVLRSLGAELEVVELRPLQHYQDVKVVMAETELFSIHLENLRARVEDFGQDFRSRALGACLFSAEDYICASRHRRAIVTEMQNLYARFDAFVTANTSPAPRIDRHNHLSFWQSPSFTTPFNCTGGPALALPCGFTSDGLPLSLQFAGRPFDDAKILQIGHAFERELGIWQKRPELTLGAAPAAIDPQPWQPNSSDVSAEVRTRAESAARAAGLDLPAAVMEELLAIAPAALAMAARLTRDHHQYDEISSIFIA